MYMNGYLMGCCNGYFIHIDMSGILLLLSMHNKKMYHILFNLIKDSDFHMEKLTNRENHLCIV